MAPYYLSALVKIAGERSSADLQTEVALERSAGRPDVHQLSEAYRYFGLQMESTSLDDEHIIGSFQSRALDAPFQQAQSREQLRIIGHHRKSKKILDTADDCKNTMTIQNSFATKLVIVAITYEQALAFLNGDESVADDFIPSLFTMKASQYLPVLSSG